MTVVVPHDGQNESHVAKPAEGELSPRPLVFDVCRFCFLMARVGATSLFGTLSQAGK